MDRSRVPLLSQKTASSQERVILPSQVWSQLTGDQQQHTQQIIVLVCRELALMPAPLQESEESHE